MAELHFPFLTSAEGCSLSNTEILDKLGWSVQDDVWVKAGPSPEPESAALLNSNRPNWSAPPTTHPDREIRAYVQHLHSVWRYNPSLQFPADWQVFSSVDWERDPLLAVGSTNSSETLACKRDKKLAHCDKNFSKRPKVPHETAVHCHLRSIHRPRVRTQWQLMQSIRPSLFKWRYQTEVRAKRRHSRRHAGFMDCNQTSPNQDRWPQASASAFLHTLRERTMSSSTHVEWLDEVHILSDVGRVISNVVATDAFPPQSQESLKWPPSLSLGTQTPIIDYTCRARDFSFGRQQRFHPLLFAAQRQGVHPKDAIQRLAIAFQPMMTLFTLYHLETRKSCEEPMPRWMVLFGVVYNHDGFYLQAFHPSFKVQDRGTSPGEYNWGWGATSAGLAYDHTHIVTKYPWRRSASVELLYRIQGHCSHVLECLRRWDGYERACNLLFIDY